MRQAKDKQLPESFRSYFWDIKFEELEVEKSSFFIIKRVLDRGNTNDVRWVLKTYGKDTIKNVILTTRDLSRPTGNFWADFLGIDKKQVPCLQKPYSPIHFGLSS